MRTTGVSSLTYYERHIAPNFVYKALIQYSTDIGLLSQASQPYIRRSTILPRIYPFQYTRTTVTFCLSTAHN